MKKYCGNRSGIDEENLAEIEAGLMKRILLNESGTFCKIIIVFCAELSEKNCRVELSAPNCPRRIVLRRIVREPAKDTNIMVLWWKFLRGSMRWACQFET